MRKNIIVIGIIFVLSIGFITISGISQSKNGGDSSILTLSDSSSIVECVKQEKKEEVIVYITKTGKKYHRGNCRYLKKSKIKISLEDACKRGYTPCKVCKPPPCPN